MRLYDEEKEGRLTLYEYLKKDGEEKLDSLFKLEGFWEEYFKENKKDLDKINKLIKKKEKYETKIKNKVMKIIKKNNRKCIEIK